MLILITIGTRFVGELVAPMDVITIPSRNGPSRLFDIHPERALTEGGRDANYRMRFHARRETLAKLDTTTGVKKTLKHESNNVREFYSSLPRPVRRGNRSHGINAVVCGPDGRTWKRMSGGSSGGDSSS
jgi:hypothetical protein